MRNHAIARVRMILALFIVTAAHGAFAEQRAGVGDGCTVLAAAVFAQLAASQALLSDGLARGAFGDGLIETTYCLQTARTVSRAFTQALSQKGIYVSWPPGLGDACLSGKLSDCYPDRSRAVPRFSSWDLAYMLDSWRAVSQTVQSIMPRGEETDVSQFRASDVRRSLSRALRKNTAGGVALYQQHYLPQVEP